MLPHDIVIEALCGFNLKGRTEEDQVRVAEQIASQTYSDLDDLVAIIKDNAPKNKFSKELQKLKSNRSFDKYWRK